MLRTDYGGAPRLQLNYVRKSDITVAPWFGPDLALLAKTIGVGIFHYGPRLWMIGEIEPLKGLQDGSRRPAIIKRIIDEYPATKFDQGKLFYRVRKDPADPTDRGEYDSPPGKGEKFGRLDSDSLSIMYASQDVEVCLHECRVTAEDELYVATLSATRDLKLLNLTHLLKETGVTEFESLDLAVNMLFCAGKHSYPIIRELALAAFHAGYDGLNYPSYFSSLRTGAVATETQYGISNRFIAAYFGQADLESYEVNKIIPNLALFGTADQTGRRRRQMHRSLGHKADRV